MQNSIEDITGLVCIGELEEKDDEVHGILSANRAAINSFLQTLPGSPVIALYNGKIAIATNSAQLPERIEGMGRAVRDFVLEHRLSRID